MKFRKIKIAIVENHHFYNHILQNQIKTLCSEKEVSNLKFDILSANSVDDLLIEKNPSYQVFLFDNYFNNNQQKASYDVSKTIEDLKSKNKNSFFISITGYREMHISAFLYRDGELKFTYSKQSAVRNENYEEGCSIPALQKLMERFIDSLLHEVSQSEQLMAA